MKEKSPTAIEVEELMSKIALHSVAIWREGLKLYKFSKANKIPSMHVLPVKSLLAIVDIYISELEAVHFIEKRAVH